MRHGCIFISGKNSFKLLTNEGGVHRVQRIPTTEKSGRIHTSTATVAILPQPSVVGILKESRFYFKLTLNRKDGISLAPIFFDSDRR